MKAGNIKEIHAFAEAMMPTLVYNHMQFGIPIVSTLAQVDLESGLDSDIFKKTNNCLGIKGKSGQGYKLYRTKSWEQDKNGAWKLRTASFIVFEGDDAIEQCLAKHRQTLFGSRYNAVRMAATPEEACYALEGEYATDQTYGDKLMQRIRDKDLMQYAKYEDHKNKTLSFTMGISLPGSDYVHRGTCVERLQLRLNELGESLTVDGVYGYRTRKAVMRFQKSNRLKADGIAGYFTQLKLFEMEG